jgi:glycosyltransferase involved in cell wall biosynthesis
MKYYFIQDPVSHLVHITFAKSINAKIIISSPIKKPFFTIFYNFFRILFNLNKYDSEGIYLCEGFFGLYFIRILKMFKPKIKIVYYDADPLFYKDYANFKGLKRKFVDFFFEKIDYILSDSNLSKKYIKRHIKVNKDVCVVHSFVNVNKFTFSPNFDSKNIIFIGRFSKEKNLINLLKAFKLIQNKYESIKLFLVGDGSFKKELKKTIKDLKLSNVIFSDGWVTDLSPYLNKSAIGYNVSDFESFGCVGLEFAVSGVIPLLGSRNGNAEILNYPEIIANPDDYKDIADRMIKLISLSNSEKKKLINKLYKASEKFNEKAQCAKFKTEFNRLVK